MRKGENKPEAPERKITMGSLFDGIGGFPLAAVRNGIEPVWASEIEAFPIAVTKLRFPQMQHVGDITRLDGAKLPPVDIICGGSPCQDLSISGARAGLAGQVTMFGPDLDAGRTSPEPTAPQEGKTSEQCWKRSCGSKNHNFMLLDLRPGAGNILGPYWEINPVWLGQPGMLNFSESPRDAVVSSLSRILMGSAPSKYSLSRTACLGILRRAKEREKRLPTQLEKGENWQQSCAHDGSSEPGRETGGIGKCVNLLSCMVQTFRTAQSLFTST